ncbi:MAG TPA: class I SAM-dependent methyltransferase [Herpetosiphonaceae bacterium]
MIDLSERYVAAAPHPQNALDIFKGQWASTLPAPFDNLEAGWANLFDDARIHWLLEQIGGCTDLSVLELGPLEGGHSAMLERAGAAEVIAIESNTHAYLKCLIVKELLGLTRTRFLCGDGIAFLKEPGRDFDLCLASGILYHMINPVELLALLSKRCARHLLLWTHYYDQAIIEPQPVVAAHFTERKAGNYEGFEHTLYRYDYQTTLQWEGFCGGSAPYSHWMSRDDILRCLKHYGFSDLRIEFDHRDHPHGPSFAVLASR